MKKHWTVKQKKTAEKMFKPKINYDAENDILYITWMPKQKVKSSVETESGFVFDISEEGYIKGVEIFNFKKKHFGEFKK